MRAKAVIVESFERIHRSNLIGMGVLPLEFKPGQNAASLGLDGSEVYDVLGIAEGLIPRQDLTIRVVKGDGTELRFPVLSRLDTPLEIGYYQHGGILPAVLRELVSEA